MTCSGHFQDFSPEIPLLGHGWPVVEDLSVGDILTVFGRSVETSPSKAATARLSLFSDPSERLLNRFQLSKSLLYAQIVQEYLCKVVCWGSGSVF